MASVNGETAVGASGEPVNVAGRDVAAGVQLLEPRPARKRVVVTGGAGFLGSHLCEVLLQRGDEGSSNLTGQRS